MDAGAEETTHAVKPRHERGLVMNVEQTKRTLKYLPGRKSVLIEGIHGMGKSQVVAQAAAELSAETGVTYGFIDMRLAQREVGDIIGMPRGMDAFTIRRTAYTNGKAVTEQICARNVTVHDLPLWFPTEPDSRGILFLDEIHYASRDVLQAVFELALDYRLNFHDLPEGWRVVAAGNGDQEIYGGSTINPALYDRFCKIAFKPTVEEWLLWARDHGVHPAVLSYVSKFNNDLDPPQSIEPGRTYPSRRSWTNLSDALLHMSSRGCRLFEDRGYFLLLCQGYVGREVGLNFTDFAMRSCAVLTAEEILGGLTDAKRRELKNAAASECAFYASLLIDHLEKTPRLTDRQNRSLAEFLRAIPRECAAFFWVGFSSKLPEPSRTWYRETPGAGAYILSLFADVDSLVSTHAEAPAHAV